MAFSDFINSIRYKKIEKINDQLSIAKKKGYGYAVLKNGKRLMDNIFDVSEIGDKFFVQTTEGAYYVFDRETSAFGRVLGTSTLQNRTPDGTYGYYGTKVPEGLLMLERNTGLYYILYAKGKSKVSEPYIKVEDPNSVGIRKVYPAIIDGKNNTRNYYYYIDEEGKGDHICVLSESEEDENGKRIAKIYNKGIDKGQMCLIDDDDRICTALFTQIVPYRGKYIATQKYQRRNNYGFVFEDSENCILDEDGEDMYIDFNKHYFMQNGALLVRPCDERNFELLNRETYEADIEDIQNPIVAEDLNMFYGKINGRPTVVGLNMRSSDIDPNVARAIMSKLIGKRIAPAIIDKIISSETDIEPTFEAFDQVIKSNINAQPDNEELFEAYGKLIKTRNALYQSSARRIRKYGEQISMLKDKTRLTTLFGEKLEGSKYRRNKAKVESTDEDGDQPQ